MASKIFYPVVAVVGIAVASGVAWWFQHRSDASAVNAVATQKASTQSAVQGGPPSVEVAAVTVARLQDDVQAVGTLRSRQSVMLRPEDAGRVAEIAFRDGTRVKRGQVLVRLDDTLEKAQLSQAEAQLSIARANVQRNEELVAQSFVARSVLDESRANLQVAEAQTALARAHLTRMRIAAPFDGVVGITKVDLGDYVKEGADLVNLEDIDALYVDFRLPERLQARVHAGQQATVTVEALPGQPFAAVVQAIDPLVDAEGRSLAVRGCIDNRKQLLRPGMFARVTTILGVRDKALVVPEEAIVPQGAKLYVFKLEPGTSELRMAHRVEVATGLRQPGRVEIVSGLTLGDVVITAGQQRVRGDTPVRIAQSAAQSPVQVATAQGLAGQVPVTVSATAGQAGNPCL